MLTIFTIPKPFKGHIATIQRNAIQSWTRLTPKCEVVLCSDEDGTEEAAREFGTAYIPCIERNEFGTPLLASAFQKASAVSKARLLCFVNADIIFLNDLMEAVKKIKFEKFLLVGQRWDVDITRPLDFARPNWQVEVRNYLERSGTLHPPYGSDYFISPKGSKLWDIPPFAVGRPGWDCWFIFHARKLGFRLIDGSKTISPVHQNHDYSHIPEKSGGTKDGKSWFGPEAEKHRRLIAKTEHYFTPLEATHIMTPKGPSLALDYVHLQRRVQTLPLLYPRIGPIVRFVDKIIPKAAKRLVRSLLGYS